MQEWPVDNDKLNSNLLFIFLQRSNWWNKLTIPPGLLSNWSLTSVNMSTINRCLPNLDISSIRHLHNNTSRDEASSFSSRSSSVVSRANKSVTLVSQQAPNCSTSRSIRTECSAEKRPNVSRQQHSTSTSVQHWRQQSTSRNNLDISTASNLPLFSTSVIMAIVEGRGKAKGEIGLAYIDLNSPILHLVQFRDNCSFDSLKMKCHVCQPVEIIYPHTLSENNMMMSSLVESFPDIDFKPFDRRFFNEKKGFEFVQTLCYKNYTWIDIELESKYYSLSACSALLHHIYTEKNVCINKCSAIHFFHY